MKQPNVIFVFGDQWRAQADRLRRRPERQHAPPRRARGRKRRIFTHAVSGCPVCSPYRASLLTGQYPLTHGVFVNDVCLARADESAQAFAAGGLRHGLHRQVAPRRPRPVDATSRRSGGRASTTGRSWSARTTTTIRLLRRRLRREALLGRLRRDAQTRDAQRYIRAARRGRSRSCSCCPGGRRTTPTKRRRPIPAGSTGASNCAAAERAGGAGGAVRDKRLGRLLRPLQRRSTTASANCCGRSREAGTRERHASSSSPPTTATCSARRGTQQAAAVGRVDPRPVPAALSARACGMAAARTDALSTRRTSCRRCWASCGAPIPRPVEGLDFSSHIRGGADPSDGAALIAARPSPNGRQRADGGREYRGVRTKRYTTCATSRRTVAALRQRGRPVPARSTCAGDPSTPPSRRCSTRG